MSKLSWRLVHLMVAFVLLFSLSSIYALEYSISLAFVQISNSLLLIGVIYPIGLAIWLLRKGSLTSRYYLIAAVISLPFIMIHLLDISFFDCGCLPGGEAIFESSLNVGVVAQAMAFSVALSARISLLRKQVTEQAIKVERVEREKLIEVQQVIEEQKEALEEEVAQRTRSLQEVIEELRMSEHNLHHLNQVKDRFFAIISHDLRGPVSAFQGISRVLHYQIKKQNTVRVQQLMDQVEQSTSQLNTLLDNLLNWAQTQLGGIRYKPQKIALALLMEDITQVYAGLALSKQVEVSLDIEPNDLSVWADLHTVSTILRNVWGNAIKFTENGRLTLRARAEGDQVHIALMDTGKGIPADKLPGIFDLSDTKSTPGTSGETGNGLGLTLCKTFALHNKGRISIESTEGLGTTVHLYLPAVRTVARDFDDQSTSS